MLYLKSTEFFSYILITFLFFSDVGKPWNWKKGKTNLNITDLENHYFCDGRRVFFQFCFLKSCSNVYTFCIFHVTNSFHEYASCRRICDKDFNKDSKIEKQMVHTNILLKFWNKNISPKQITINCV